MTKAWAEICFSLIGQVISASVSQFLNTAAYPMFMKHPGELQSGKWQRRCTTNSRCGFIAHGVNIKRVESHLV